MLINTDLHNISYEESLRNIVLILLGQHSTVKNLCNVVWEAPDNITNEKNPVQCYPNTPGTILYWANPV